jgi:hypothetical protein
MEKREKQGEARVLEGAPIALITRPSSQLPVCASTALEPAEKPIRARRSPRARWAAMELQCLWPFAMPVAIPTPIGSSGTVA